VAREFVEGGLQARRATTLVTQTPATVLPALKRLVAGDLADVLVGEGVTGRRTALGVAAMSAAGASDGAGHVAEHRRLVGRVRGVEREGLQAGEPLGVELAATWHVDGPLAGRTVANVAVLGARVNAAVELLLALLRAGGDRVEAAGARGDEEQDVGLAARALLDALGQQRALVARTGMADALAGVVAAG